MSDRTNIRQHPSLNQMEEIYKRWSTKHPDIFSYSKAGCSKKGMPIWLCKITNNNISNANKEVALICSTHAGQEISATNTIFYVMHWLLGNNPTTNHIRNSQIVYFMPCVNPEGYKDITHGNSNGADPYLSYDLSGPNNLDNCPEAKVMAQITDTICPDVVLDVHGLPFNCDYWMLENTGAAYSVTFCRPFHNDIMAKMDLAAESLGYPQHRAENDNELYPSTTQTKFSRHFIGRGALVNYSVYAYNKCHSLAFCTEVAWEKSGLEKIKALLEMGSSTYQTEYYDGYPSRVVRSSCTYQISAYGNNATARRKSRYEIWNATDYISMSFCAPQKTGKNVCFIGLGDGIDTFRETNQPIHYLLEKLKSDNNINIEGIETFISDLPDSVVVTQPETPEDDIACRESKWKMLAKRDTSGFQGLKHGLSLRFWIPFGKAETNEVLYNGNKLVKSELDGYIEWKGRGYSFIQINIPPEKINKVMFFGVKYNPKEKRQVGFDPFTILDNN